MNQFGKQFTDLLPYTREASIDVHDPRFEPVKDLVAEHIAKRGISYFKNVANDAAVREHGSMSYAIVSPVDSPSPDQLLLMPTPFANGVWPHMIARAEALSLVASQAGLVDRDGQPLPVLVTGSPGKISRFGLNEQEADLVKSGDTTPLVERHIVLANRLGYSGLRGIVAASQPAIFAGLLMARAKNHFDVDGNAVYNEPANARCATLPKQLGAIVRDGMKFGATIKDEKIPLLKDIIHAPGFLPGIFHARTDNLPLARCFGLGGLSGQIEHAGRAGVLSVIIHGDKSRVAPRDDVVLAVRAADRKIIKEGLRNDMDMPRPYRIEVKGADHNLHDRLGVSSAMAAVALTATPDSFSTY